MVQDLSSYRSIQTNYFVRIDVPGAGNRILVSDYHTDYTIGGYTYTAVGDLLNLSKTTSNIRATSEEFSIGLSGIPSGNISKFINQKVKGSEVYVTRGIFNPSNGTLLSIANNPNTKFSGVVNNYSIKDDLNGSDGELIIALTVTSVVDQLTNKVSGRRTNPIDQQEFYPNDESFDRVPQLSKSNFNFGAPS
jgi:hypothetical protein